MAGGGLFARLGNLWRGFLSLWISDVEKQHPEIAYENAINSPVARSSFGCAVKVFAFICPRKSHSPIVSSVCGSTAIGGLSSFRASR